MDEESKGLEEDESFGLGISTQSSLSSSSLQSCKGCREGNIPAAGFFEAREEVFLVPVFAGPWEDTGSGSGSSGSTSERSDAQGSVSVDPASISCRSNS